LGGIIHRASNMGVINVSNMGVINVQSATPTTDNGMLVIKHG